MEHAPNVPECWECLEKQPMIVNCDMLRKFCFQEHALYADILDKTHEILQNYNPGESHRTGSEDACDVNCIVHNEEYMTCTWNLTGGNIKYTMYHWYVAEPAVECRNYIQQGGYNVGCNFSASDIIQFKDFHVLINGSSDSGIVTASNKKFQLQNQVQPFPPGNLRVNTSESNGLLLKWDAPMRAETCLEYEIRHRNNKDKEWQKVSVTTQTMFNLASVDPEKLYTFQVRSKINIHRGTTELWSGWSLPAYWGNFITDVNCIVHNEEYMTCTWNITGGNIKYTMYHWYVTQPAVECRNYIQQVGYNIGCNFSASDIIQFKDFHILINGSSDSGIVTTSNRKFQLQDQVQPFPPGNLRVNTSESNGLLLKWDAPMDTERCLEYEIRHRNNKDKEWQKVSVTAQTKFNLASVDPEKLYTFHVRSKINIYCGTTELWSGWSLPVSWGKNDTQTEDSKESFNTYVTVVSIVVLTLLVICLIRIERLKVIIIPKIPNPGRNFDPLFNNHNGNFQDWLGVSKDTLDGFKSSYYENVCIVSESPPDSTPSSVHDGSYDHLGRTDNPEKTFNPDNKGDAHPKFTSPAMMFSDITDFVENSRL
ncbi:prolactin receptor-like [Hemitrygon akajei]|uniref:prolactin receptor-like n=1 Tax=Hemitrygon akajei TaxID=2704970 RepID=UPI003BFA195D